MEFVKEEIFGMLEEEGEDVIWACFGALKSGELRVKLQTDKSKELEGEMGIDMMKDVPHSFLCKVLTEVHSGIQLDCQNFRRARGVIMTEFLFQHQMTGAFTMPRTTTYEQISHVLAARRLAVPGRVQQTAAVLDQTNARREYNDDESGVYKRLIDDETKKFVGFVHIASGIEANSLKIVYIFM